MDDNTLVDGCCASDLDVDDGPDRHVPHSLLKRNIIPRPADQRPALLDLIGYTIDQNSPPPLIL